MSATTLLLLLIPVVLAGAAIHILWRMAPARRRGARQPATGDTIVVQPFMQQLRYNVETDTPIRRGVIVCILVGLFITLLLRVFPTPASDDFTVLVAPFQETDGAVTQTGRSAAAQLVAALAANTNRRVVARTIDTAPADAAAAQQLLERYGADALIWGAIAPGAMLDQEALTPQLAYRPTGSFAPYAWEGYNGRFALPSTYRIAARPINGEVLLPPMLDALAAYSAGNADQAARQLTQLQTDYPWLDPALPGVILANIHWAGGEYDQAARDYQTVIDSNPSWPPQDAARLYNKLGAVLQDAGDARAREAFNQAIAILNANHSDLGELRFNLGLEALNTGDPQAAAEGLRAAYAQQAPSTALLSAMSEAYRRAGYLQRDTGQSLDDAREATAAIEGQIVHDSDLVPADLRTLIAARLQAQNDREEALTALAQEIGLNGPLLWGLEHNQSLSSSSLRRIAGLLDDAITQSQSRARGWSQRSASEDAAGRTVNGRIATSQARLAERDQRELQRWQAAIAIELGEVQGAQPQGFWGFLTGITDRRPLSETLKTLDQLIQLEPRDVDLYILAGHALLARGQVPEASARFSTAQSYGPQRPEPLYGLALAALADPARSGEARSLLQQAIERDANFYPARFKLAEIDEQANNWAAAIEQRRHLYSDYPGDRTALALAQALRRSGPEGYTEAEQVLVPLANNDNVDALVELGRIYEASNDAAGAQAVLERAQRIAPGNADVTYDLGILAWRRGDTAEAEREFRLALTADRKHIPSLLAMAELSQGRPGERTAFYRQALDAGANDVAQLKSIGAVLLAMDEPDLALRAFQRAGQVSNHSDPDAMIGEARAQLMLRNLDAAEQAARQALTYGGGDTATAQLVLGDVGLERGRIDDAQAAFGEALRIKPDLVDAHIGLGRVAMLRGEWSVAASRFQDAVRAAPESPDAHRWLGDALTQSGSLDAAVAEYQLALDRQSTYPEALYGMARAQAGQGQLGPAQANLEAAIKLRPKYADALLLQGKIYEQLGQERQAMTAYEHAIAADGRLAEPRFRRALLLVQANRLREARGELTAAVSAQPQYPEANYWLGRVEFADGNYREALHWFQAAVDQANQNGQRYAEALFYQGLAEEQLGMREQAVASLQASLTESGTSAWASEARSALSRLGNP
jgi:tetratricopeptide (TPR) repeat protein